MNKLKPSVFNSYAVNESNQLILYNSFNDNANIAKFTSSDAHYIQELLNTKEIICDSPIIEWLSKHEFLVSTEENEINKLQLKYMQYITDNKLHLYILPTFSCNLRCKYCYEKHSDEQMDVGIQNAIIIYVQRNISKYTGLHVSWFGGEPLLALESIVTMSKKFIKICQACHRTYEADMSTNGYLLTKETFDILTSLKVRFYQITLDGLKNVHNKLKMTIDGGSTFDVILNNLINIQKNCKIRNITIIIRSNFIRENLIDMERYVDFYYGIFGKDKRFYFAPGAAGNWGYSGENCDSNMFITTKEIKIIFDKLLQCKHVLNYGFFSNFSKYGRTICYASKLNSYAIGPNGVVYKCTCNFDMDENKIGFIDGNGELRLNIAKYSKWVVGAMMSLHEACNSCFFSGKCCGSYCIANSLIKREKEGFRCFPPFSKSYFTQQILLYDKFMPIKITSFE